MVQRKRRALKQAAAVAEIINEDRQKFTGDGVDLLVSVYQDVTVPLGTRLVCTREAARDERSQRSPTDAPSPGSQPSGRRIDVAKLSADQRTTLLEILQSAAVKGVDEDASGGKADRGAGSRSDRAV